MRMKKLLSSVLACFLLCLPLPTLADTIEVPRGITSNREEAFAACVSSAQPADSLLLPFTFRDFDAMGNDMYVQNILVPGDHPLYTSAEGVLFSKSMDTLVAYPLARPALSYSVPEGVLVLGEGSLQYWQCDLPYQIDDWETVSPVITLPSSLKVIEPYAMSYAAIRQIIFPEGLIIIDEYAFEECEWLSAVTWPSTLTVIGEGAFCGCGFSELQLPEGLEVINAAAFSVCPLEKVILPRSLRYIDETAFWDSYSPETFEEPLFYVYPGSYAEQWVQEQGLPYAHVKP